jgi:hypothetical protein
VAVPDGVGRATGDGVDVVDRAAAPGDIDIRMTAAVIGDAVDLSNASGEVTFGDSRA